MEGKKSLSRALEVKPGFLDTLRVPGVTHLSPRIRSGALLTYKNITRYISVLAVDPANEQYITSIQNLIEKGNPPIDDKKSRGALIGYRLARALGADIGSEMFLVTSQLDGSMGAIKLKVSDIYHAKGSHLELRIQDQKQRIILPLL